MSEELARQNEQERMESIEQLRFLVYCCERDAWWMPNRRGYTVDVGRAGRYSLADALEIAHEANAFGSVNEMLVPVEDRMNYKTGKSRARTISGVDIPPSPTTPPPEEDL